MSIDWNNAEMYGGERPHPVATAMVGPMRIAWKADARGAQPFVFEVKGDRLHKLQNGGETPWRVRTRIPTLPSGEKFEELRHAAQRAVDEFGRIEHHRNITESTAEVKVELWNALTNIDAAIDAEEAKAKPAEKSLSEEIIEGLKELVEKLERKAVTK